MSPSNRHQSETPFFTIRELAEDWRCSERHIRRLIAKGELIAHRLGNLVRIRADDKRAYERASRDT